ncbi:MAG: calcium-binding protein [Nitrospirota bacterium]
MSKSKTDKSRETRIDDEIIVDCYGEAERAMGWYYYLQDHLEFPFAAKCIAARSISPLKTGEAAEVVGMAPEVECEREMFVAIRWEKRKFGVPLAQLEGIKTSKETKEAIEDRRYWVARGYEF